MGAAEEVAAYEKAVAEEPLREALNQMNASRSR